MFRWAVLGLTLLFKVFGAYFLVIGLFTVRKPKAFRRSSPKHRFACLIAARNEEAVIYDTARSLRKQNYPRRLYDVYVAVNNSVDSTAARAANAGARVIFCPETVKNKGEALRFSLEKNVPDTYDAVCVFDADNLVDVNFLAAMNDALGEGVQAAKGAMRAKDPYGTWVAGCYGLYYTMFDLFYSRPRMNLGLSSKLVGTGFMLSKQALRAVGGFCSSTIAEDAELSATLAEKGIRVWFVPDALTLDEPPMKFMTSLTQRRRWVSGVMEVARLKALPLLRGLGKPGGMRRLDMLTMLLAPWVQLAGLLPTACLTLMEAASAEPAAWALTMGAGLLGAYALCTAAAGVLAMAGNYRSRRIVPSVFLFPLFMAAWLPLEIVSLFAPVKTWKQVPHGENMKKTA